MRKALAILLSVLLIVSVTPAQTRHDWSNIENLKRGALLIVQLRAGERIYGYLLSVSDDGLRIAARDPSQMDTTYLREISRADIQRIVLDRKAQNLPNPRAWAIGGAIIGGATGMGLGIHRDISEPSACGHGCWLIGGVAGAGGGFMVGLMSAGVVGMARMLGRNKLIYEDDSARRSHQ